MKKAILLLALSLFLMGCGGKPSDVSDEAYAMAVEAIEAVDQYTEGDADLEETLDKLYEIDVEIISVDDFLSLERDQSEELADKNVDIEIKILDIRTQLSTLRHYSNEEYESNTMETVNAIKAELEKLVNYK